MTVLIKSVKHRRQANELFVYEMNSNDKQTYTCTGVQRMFYSYLMISKKKKNYEFLLGQELLLVF